MLRHFTVKKAKKHPTETKERSHSPILSAQDEQFLEHIVSDEGPSSAHAQLVEAGDTADGPAQPVAGEGRSKDQHSDPATVEGSKSDSSTATNRWSFLQRFTSKKGKRDGKAQELLIPTEVRREGDDITAVLDDLNLAATNSRVSTLSKESRELVRKFSLVLQDLVNGVPTAYDDLLHLLDNSQEQLEKSYERLPSYLQKLIRTLPKKLTGTLAPEILATAAAGQGVSSTQAGDMKNAAKKSGVRMPSLYDMVSKPGAIAGILRTIMNFLKLRWPAFMGTSVLWSLGIFVLLLVFWYCHKRGREVRLAKESADAGDVDDDQRIVEIDDDEDDSLDMTDDVHHSVAANRKSRS